MNLKHMVATIVVTATLAVLATLTLTASAWQATLRAAAPVGPTPKAVSAARDPLFAMPATYLAAAREAGEVFVEDCCPLDPDEAAQHPILQMVYGGIRPHGTKALLQHIGDEFRVEDPNRGVAPQWAANSALAARLLFWTQVNDHTKVPLPRIVTLLRQEYAPLPANPAVGEIQRVGVVTCCWQRPQAKAGDPLEVVGWEFRAFQNDAVVWTRWVWLGPEQPAAGNPGNAWINRGEWNIDRANGFGQTYVEQVDW